MRCWFFHQWQPVRVDGPVNYDYLFARTFGNALLIERCDRCAKERSTPKFIREDTRHDG